VPPPQYDPYGQTPPAYGQTPYGYEKPTHVPSLVLCIIAIVTVWFTGITGIVCGAIAVSLARKNKNEYKTTAGFVTGLIGLIIGILILVVMIIAIALFGIAAAGGLGALSELGNYYY
jgi:heme/copper-type cytochrome/quinol oxidase subunit 2